MQVSSFLVCVVFCASDFLKLLWKNATTQGDDKRRLCLRLSVFVCVKEVAKELFLFILQKSFILIFFSRSFLSRISSSYKQLICEGFITIFVCVPLLARESIVVNRYWIKIKAGHLRFAQHQCKMLYIHVYGRWWLGFAVDESFYRYKVSRRVSSFLCTCARSHI